MSALKRSLAEERQAHARAEEPGRLSAQAPGFATPITPQPTARPGVARRLRREIVRAAVDDEPAANDRPLAGVQAQALHRDVDLRVPGGVGLDVAQIAGVMRSRIGCAVRVRFAANCRPRWRRRAPSSRRIRARGSRASRRV